MLLPKHKDCTDCSRLLQGCAQLTEKPADGMVFIQNKDYTKLLMVIIVVACVCQVISLYPS